MIKLVEGLLFLRLHACTQKWQTCIECVVTLQARAEERKKADSTSSALTGSAARGRTPRKRSYGSATTRQLNDPAAQGCQISVSAALR